MNSYYSCDIDMSVKIIKCFSVVNEISWKSVSYREIVFVSLFSVSRQRAPIQLPLQGEHNMEKNNYVLVSEVTANSKPDILFWVPCIWKRVIEWIIQVAGESHTSLSSLSSFIFRWCLIRTLFNVTYPNKEIWLLIGILTFCTSCELEIQISHLSGFLKYALSYCNFEFECLYCHYTQYNEIKNESLFSANMLAKNI